MKEYYERKYEQKEYYVQGSELKELVRGGEDAKPKIYSKNEVKELLILPDSFGYFTFTRNPWARKAMDIKKNKIVTKEYYSEKEAQDLLNRFSGKYHDELSDEDKVLVQSFDVYVDVNSPVYD